MAINTAFLNAFFLSLLCINAVLGQSLPSTTTDFWYTPTSIADRLPNTASCSATPCTNSSVPTCCSVGGDNWCAGPNAVCCGCVPFGSCYVCKQGTCRMDEREKDSPCRWQMHRSGPLRHTNRFLGRNCYYLWLWFVFGCLLCNCYLLLYIQSPLLLLSWLWILLIFCRKIL